MLIGARVSNDATIKWLDSTSTKEPRSRRIDAVVQWSREHAYHNAVCPWTANNNERITRLAIEKRELDAESRFCKLL
jgi:hypothetical protein